MRRKTKIITVFLNGNRFLKKQTHVFIFSRFKRQIIAHIQSITSCQLYNTASCVIVSIKKTTHHLHLSLRRTKQMPLPEDSWCHFSRRRKTELQYSSFFNYRFAPVMMRTGRVHSEARGAPTHLNMCLGVHLTKPDSKTIGWKRIRYRSAAEVYCTLSGRFLCGNYLHASSCDAPWRWCCGGLAHVGIQASWGI